MKKHLIAFLSGTVLMGVNVFAQTPAVKGVQWNEQTSKIKIVNLDQHGSVLNNVGEVSIQNGQKYLANSLYNNQSSGMLTFVTETNDPTLRFAVHPGAQQIVFANAQNGEVIKTVPINASIMTSFAIGEKNRMGFITEEGNFNPYGNNNEDISMVVFDMNTGGLTGKIKLSSLSITSGVNAPFVGNVTPVDGNGLAQDVSLSNVCYVHKTQMLYFASKDVTGTNKLFKINAASNVIESQTTIDYDILDFVYDNTKDNLKVLFVEKSGEESILKIGEMSLKTHEITAQNEVVNLGGVKIINDGFVKIDAQNEFIFVGKMINGKMNVYTFGSDLNLVSQVTNQNTDRLDFEFPYSFQNSATIADGVISMYPNPATSEVTVESDLTTVTNVKIMNMLGEVVRVIEVQSGLRANTISVDGLVPGAYTLSIESDKSVTENKTLIIQ
ncbi:MAG: T9SS type A sorting domain-containing protein [Flavobacteriales bacterium]|nr:T9SS type A sorting domain-containing protein [Flavobacteriales bacterium]